MISNIKLVLKLSFIVIIFFPWNVQASLTKNHACPVLNSSDINLIRGSDSRCSIVFKKAGAGDNQFDCDNTTNGPDRTARPCTITYDKSDCDTIASHIKNDNFRVTFTQVAVRSELNQSYVSCLYEHKDNIQNFVIKLSHFYTENFSGNRGTWNPTSEPNIFHCEAEDPSLCDFITSTK